MRSSRLIRYWCAGTMALAAGAASAHHSFARFDTTKLVAVHGTVTDWVWSNPHCWLYLTVKRANGTTERWGLEGGSPNMLIRWGWNYADIKKGDEISVDVHPARDGQHIASMQTIFARGGKVLRDSMGQARPVTGDELETGLAEKPPTKPQGVPY